MPREEATEIEQPCIKIAEAAGWLHRKLDVGPGGKGWLDELFIGPNRKCFFAEFKTVNGSLSEKQKKLIKRLKEYGHRVYVVTSEDEFTEILKLQV